MFLSDVGSSAPNDLKYFWNAFSQVYYQFVQNSKPFLFIWSMLIYRSKDFTSYTAFLCDSHGKKTKQIAWHHCKFRWILIFFFTHVLPLILASQGWLLWGHPCCAWYYVHLRRIIIPLRLYLLVLTHFLNISFRAHKLATFAWTYEGNLVNDIFSSYAH